MLFLFQHSNLFRDLLFLRLYISINTCDPRIHAENIKGPRHFWGQGRISRKMIQINLHYIDFVLAKKTFGTCSWKSPTNDSFALVYIHLSDICYKLVLQSWKLGQKFKKFFGQGNTPFPLHPGYVRDILHIYIIKL